MWGLESSSRCRAESLEVLSLEDSAVCQRLWRLSEDYFSMLSSMSEVMGALPLRSDASWEWSSLAVRDFVSASMAACCAGVSGSVARRCAVRANSC